MEDESNLDHESCIINDISNINSQQRMINPKHYKFCEECLPDVCTVRTKYKTFKMHLKTTDRLLLLDSFGVEHGDDDDDDDDSPSESHDVTNDGTSDVVSTSTSRSQTTHNSQSIQSIQSLHPIQPIQPLQPIQTTQITQTTQTTHNAHHSQRAAPPVHPVHHTHNTRSVQSSTQNAHHIRSAEHPHVATTAVAAVSQAGRLYCTRRVKIRKLLIRYNGVYIARQLLHSGLDIFYKHAYQNELLSSMGPNYRQPRMLSDRQDFYFHYHPFFLRYLIRLNVPDIEQEIMQVSHEILDKCKWFIGDVTDYLNRRPLDDVVVHAVSELCGQTVYRILLNSSLLGYAGDYNIMAYDASQPVGGFDEDNTFEEEAIIRYTDRKTRVTDDGIFFGGDAFYNFANSLLGVKEHIRSCTNCKLANK